MSKVEWGLTAIAAFALMSWISFLGWHPVLRLPLCGVTGMLSGLATVRAYVTPWNRP